MSTDESHRMGPLLLAHDDEGSGPAVVLLHAAVADRGMWASIVPTLAVTHRVIVPDLRGFGETPLPGEAYADADDVIHLLDALGVEQAAVIGASFGGRVALEVAARHPARVSSLVLMCSAYGGLKVTDPVVQAFGQREGELLEAGDIDAAVALNVDTWVGPEASDEDRAAVARMQRRAFEVQLAAGALVPAPQQERIDVDPTAIVVPTVILSGAHDVQHFREIAALLASEIASAEHLELAWAGHLPALERPEETAALLLAHLENGSVAPIV